MGETAVLTTACRIASAPTRIIPWATHLFEEPGALDLVAEQVGGWFTAYL